MAAKLSPEQVEIIRERVAAGASRRELAWFFGVGTETISRVVRGNTWVRDQEQSVVAQPELTDRELRASAKRLFEEQERGRTLEKLRQGREESGPPAAPVSDVPEEGTALTPERVLWLLGQG